MKKILITLIIIISFITIVSIGLTLLISKKKCTCIGLKTTNGCFGIKTPCTGLIDLCERDKKFCL